MRWKLGAVLMISAGFALACGGLEDADDGTTYSGGGDLFDPTDFRAEISSPPTVQNGETFEIAVTVFNDAPHTQKLHSLDIADEYLAGIDVVGSDPAYGDTFHVPIDNTESYEYMKDIPSGGSMVVRLNMLATDAGTWTGDIDVCVNGDARFRAYPVTTTIQ